MSRPTSDVSPWPRGNPLRNGLAAESLEYIAEELALGDMDYDAILDMLQQVARRGEVER
ncbi:MAG TPA: hypothetical protein PKA98_09740 [Acidimicrobiales bacterium]|nr:hypothetical protein [Acidimicrobiales bacterium]